jgi:hypothetical protein
VGGAQLPGHRQLLVEQIHRHDLRTSDERILQRQVAEPADAEDGDQVGGTGSRHLHGLVGRDAGAGERCGLERIDAVRDLAYVASGGQGIFGPSAVD